MLASLGWMVVHALWLSTLIAGVLALVLALLGDSHARLKYAVASAALAAMLVAPLFVVLASLDFLTPSARQQATTIVDAAVGLSSFVSWRGPIVRAAAMLWAAGVVIGLVRLGAEWLRLRRLRRDPSLQADAALSRAVADLAADLRIRPVARVFKSPSVEAPMVFGLWTPTILLPADSTSALTGSQLRAVLAHELAHVGRRDYAANLAQVVADTLLWCHPAARWVSARIRTEREYCCDDVALRTGAAPIAYARALAELDDARDAGRLVVAAASGTLLDRIQRIVHEPRPVWTPARGSLVFLASVGAALVWLTLTMVVPPNVPLDARLRQRTPQAGPSSQPAPMIPRSPRPPR